MNSVIKVSCLLFVLIQSSTLFTQANRHPVIWVTEEERPRILNLIQEHQWARNIVVQLHERVDSLKTVHLTAPSSLLGTVPEFGTEAARHNALLTLAAESGMLYYLTREKSYAQFAADIIAAYTSRIAPLTPETTQIGGDEFLDPRSTYNMLALAYDFTYDYLTSGEATAYSPMTDSREKFDNTAAQAAFTNIVGNILQEYGRPDKHGRVVSNHPILTAPGAIYTIMCLEDDAERERLLKVFWETGTWHQASFQHTVLPLFSEQALWPESLSYSFMPLVSLIINIVDRLKPEWDVAEQNRHIFEGSLLFDQLRLPDRRFVRYGDSKRNNDGTELNYLFALDIAERNNFSDLKLQFRDALRKRYKTEGGRSHQLSDGMFDNSDYLSLFWGHPLPETEVEDLAYKPTVVIEHAGIALQRNYVDERNERYGLCGIIGGAHYVHSHCTGITMELYGAGYVMAPNAGLPKSVAERQIPLHENYFRLYAGNNTVIVNGSSHGRDEGSWKGKANVWQNTAVNIAAEPAHLQSPLSEQFSFATQRLDDEVNDAIQERTLSVVRTSDSTGYYFDMFRSRSLNENRFHDYVYHNIGDGMQITDPYGTQIETNATDRYQTDIGDEVHSPGWRYFMETEVTEPTEGAVHLRFDVDYDGRYMHMFVPGGTERSYTRGLAPPTREAKNGYLDKPTQVVAIRQEGEAWDRPYSVVFEPTLGSNASVKRVETLRDGKRVVGAIVSSRVGPRLVTDYIICQADGEATYKHPKLDFTFTGRFGIARVEELGGERQIHLYVGDGESLRFDGNSLNAGDSGRAFKTFK